MTTQETRKCGCIRDPAQLFKHVVSAWVLTVAVAVGFTCWVFIANKTDAAVDSLSWRMVGVVRVLAKEQVSPKPTPHACKAARVNSSTDIF